MKVKHCIFLFAMLYSISGHCQKEAFIFGGYGSYNHTGKLSNRIQLNSNFFGAVPLGYMYMGRPTFDVDLYIATIEQTLKYKVADKFTIGGGYTLQRYGIISIFPVWDKRVFLEGTFIDSSDNSEFQHRLRLERRQISVWYIPVTSVSKRLRYRFSLSTPINDRKYLTLNFEPFVSLNNNIPSRFNEMWWYLGIGKKTRANQRFEFGVQSINLKYSNNSWFRQYYFSVSWFRTPKN